RELARANAWWDVTPQVEYQRIGNDNTFGVGLSMPLRLFDRNQGELARTAAEIERAQAMREAAVRRVLAEVDVAISQVQTEHKGWQILVAARRHRRGGRSLRVARGVLKRRMKNRHQGHPLLRFPRPDRPG